nr:MAG TPA: hypothetical protein [Caudoviricetes sp.]DAJ13344.1 MAG TPA: hypothetical protein [Siphoviridae sp. ctX8T1]
MAQGHVHGCVGTSLSSRLVHGQRAKAVAR